jgi:ketosteroid isomerase-like protein
MKIPHWKTITVGVAAASLAIASGAVPSQAAPAANGAKVSNNSSELSSSSLSKLPLTSRNLSKREKVNLAVVLRAYHVAEGDSTNVKAFVNSFTKDGVFNDVVAGKTYRGNQLGDVLTNMDKLFPDVHRELKRITVNGDVVSVELSIQGTFKGPLLTPAGTVKPTGAKVDVPTADFWYLRNGKIQRFNCYVGYSVMFRQMGVNFDRASAVAAS